MKLLGVDVSKYWSDDKEKEDDVQAPEAKRFKQDKTIEQVM